MKQLFLFLKTHSRIFLLGFVGAVVLFLAVLYLLPFSLPTVPFSLVVYDRDKNEIGEIVYEKSIRHRPTSISSVPPFLLKGLLAAEDRDFYGHFGVSPRGIVRSALANFSAGTIVQGSSTIEMQLAKNLFHNTGSRTVFNKIAEMFMALQMNAHMNKEQILEKYIDSIPLGYMTYGIASASQWYFHKDIATLSQSEQVGLLTLVKNPAVYNPYSNPSIFFSRYKLMVKTLLSQKIITPTEAKTLQKNLPQFAPLVENPLPYAFDYIKKQHIADGKTPSLITTFSQSFSESIKSEALAALFKISWKNVGDFGVVIADRNTREIRVLIGGSSYQNKKDGQVNAVTALRLPGSTIKPFTYALAFDTLGYTPNTQVLDVPTQFLTTQGFGYAPKNYSMSYEGSVSVAEALAGSLNIPAVRTLQELWVAKLLTLLRSNGVTTLKENIDYYGLALTLGDGEMSLLELTQAYDIFANKWLHCDFVHTQKALPDSCRRTISEKAANYVADILSSKSAKMKHFPLYSALSFEDIEVAVKTGTSRNFKDNWSVGFDKNYLIGVWAGNKNGDNMKGVSGATGAGEIFARIVYLLNGKSEEGKKDTVFLLNTKKYAHISTPLKAARYLFSAQKKEIRLEYLSNIAAKKVVWKVDGKIVEGAYIPLTLGKHTVELTMQDENGTIFSDSSSYEVVDKEDQ